MAFRRAVRVGLHRHHPAVPRTAAGQPVVEGQRARGHRPGAQQPVAGRRGRRVPRHVRQPVLRQAERPHHLAAGHATTVDGDRACWAGRSGSSWSRWHPTSGSSWSVGASPRCSSTRCSPRSSRCCPTRSRSPNAAASRVSWASVCRSRRSAAPTSSSCSPATPSRCSSPRAPSAGSSSCSSPRTLNDRRLRRGGQAGLVAARVRERVLRQPAEEPRLRLGVRQPVHVRPGLRLPDHLPGLLPAGEARQRRGRRPAPAVPRHLGHVERGRRRLPGRRMALGPDRAAQGLRGRRIDRVRSGACSSSHSPAASTASWPGWRWAGSGSACTRPSTSPWSPTCCRIPPAPRRTSA